MPREQDQFLDVIDSDLARSRWAEVVRPSCLGSQIVPLAEALGRILASDVFSPVDVPGFDRSNLDGFALRAEETFDASEEMPCSFVLNAEELATGIVPSVAVRPGTATPIATGGMMPRGGDAVAMVEITSLQGDRVLVKKPVTPGAGLTFAGTDIARGELVFRARSLLTARETGVLAAIGRGTVEVVRRPRVAIFSTGNEIARPGEPLPVGAIYDANATMLADAVRELGGEPVALGIVPDDEVLLNAALDEASTYDVVLLSGGTSKGDGDLSYRVLSRRSPGIVVHGVALKPGKPVCLGAIGTIPVAILPGFPTSAIFTFHELVAPLIRTLGGRPAGSNETLTATLPSRINSERGRAEFVLVNLLDSPEGLVAFPMGKGSGSVSAIGRADGFLTIPKGQEFVDSGEPVTITILGRGIAATDLVAIGSHCVGLDLLLGLLQDRGFRAKTIWVGSQGGLYATAGGECDIAGIHLLDTTSGEYNRPFLPDSVRLVEGYGRMQGIVSRPGDPRFAGSWDIGEIWDRLDGAAMVNRNRGSGTRVLIDGLLKGRKPEGFAVEARSHNAVCASVAQNRADWGVAIAPVAAMYGLGFRPLVAERYDFAIPLARWDRPAVAEFRRVLADPATRTLLRSRGFLLDEARP